MAAMMQKNTSELCREWIASILRGDGFAEMPANEDAVVAAALDEGIAPLLLDALGAGLCASHREVATLTSKLVAAVRDQVAVEMLRKAEMHRVTNKLVDAGVPFLVLKGAALAYRVYDQPHQRPRCDLDLLMPAARVVDSARPLLESMDYRDTGYGTDTLITNESAFRRQAPGGMVYWVDAHWALTGTPLFGYRFTYEELALDSVAVMGFPEQVRGLSDVHALIHACVHRVQNMRHGNEDRLIWLYDLLLLAKRLTPVAWERLIDLAISRGLAGPVLSGLEAAVRWVSCPLPENGLELLRRAAASEAFDVNNAKKAGYLEWHNFQALPIRLRARWVWQKLFPSLKFIQVRNGAHSRGVTAADYGRRLLDAMRLFVR